MNLMNNPSLIEQLAASYAIGTLRGGARRRFEQLARTQVALRTAALAWQARLASLTELQPHIAPSPAVWKRIENLIAAERDSKAMQQARAEAAAHAPAAGRWWSSLSLWRAVAAGGVTAAVLALVMGNQLRASNASLGAQVAHLGAEVQNLSTRLAAAPQIQYVAVLTDDKAAASMLVTLDTKTRKLTLKRVGGFQEDADKSLQLWALPQQGGPQSLGVLGRDAVVRLAAGSAVRRAPALAISLEPVGGAPAGSGPTGPVLFKGPLIEAPL